MCAQSPSGPNPRLFTSCYLHAGNVADGHPASVYNVEYLQHFWLFANVVLRKLPNQYCGAKEHFIILDIYYKIKGVISELWTWCCGIFYVAECRNFNKNTFRFVRSIQMLERNSPKIHFGWML